MYPINTGDDHTVLVKEINMSNNTLQQHQQTLPISVSLPLLQYPPTTTLQYSPPPFNIPLPIPLPPSISPITLF